MGIKWTEEDMVLALFLYLNSDSSRGKGKRIEEFYEKYFSKAHKKLLGKDEEISIDSLKRRLNNYQYIDTCGIKGQSGNNKRNVNVPAPKPLKTWNDWATSSQKLDNLKKEVERIIKKIDSTIEYDFDKFLEKKKYIEREIENTKLPVGVPLNTTKERMTEVRTIQYKFSKNIRLVYNETCCITGISVPKLLEASHIKPWKDANDYERGDIKNGLLLNSLHHAAFDAGYITVVKDNNDFKVKVSSQLKDFCKGNDNIKQFFLDYDNKKIRVPKKQYIPDKEYLEFHNKNIFMG